MTIYAEVTCIDKSQYSAPFYRIKKFPSHIILKIKDESISIPWCQIKRIREFEVND